MDWTREFLNAWRFALKQLGAFFDGAENDTQESLANQMACMDQGRCQHAQKPFAEENPGHSDFTVYEAIPWSHSTKSALTEYVDRPSSLIATGETEILPEKLSFATIDVVAFEMSADHAA